MVRWLKEKYKLDIICFVIHNIEFIWIITHICDVQVG